LCQKSTNFISIAFHFHSFERIKSRSLLAWAKIQNLQPKMIDRQLSLAKNVWSALNDENKKDSEIVHFWHTNCSTIYTVPGLQQLFESE
jgi:hypothetical protein